ncbi:vegetative cell wall protein gp1-like [Zingiber officinale]|uniref:vegetative cell wall protein gp1-like n=1 Tax=Zingiber officinale TaxID=94328 RepID=UPI001C4CCE2C|nr:vegetative cell wall protein gp1-like [Zingiber officinale]
MPLVRRHQASSKESDTDEQPLAQRTRCQPVGPGLASEAPTATPSSRPTSMSVPDPQPSSDLVRPPRPKAKAERGKVSAVKEEINLRWQYKSHAPARPSPRPTASSQPDPSTHPEPAPSSSGPSAPLGSIPTSPGPSTQPGSASTQPGPSRTAPNSSKPRYLRYRATLPTEWGMCGSLAAPTRNILLRGCLASQ